MAIKSFFSALYEKLITINDSPQKVALGFGLGVFCGILPGTGPVASLALAFIFRVNRAAALAGSLLTNTWLSVVTFVLSIKVGAALTGTYWYETYQKCQLLAKDFHLKDLWHASYFKIFWPLVVGYAAVALLLGVATYLVTLAILIQREKMKRGHGC